MDARSIVKSALEALGFDADEFAIEHSQRQGRDLEFEATSISRGVSVSAVVVVQHGAVRVNADCESACHSWHRSALL